MLFKRTFLDRIADGSISLAFRRWQKTTVKAGGSLRTPVGVLAIEDVCPINEVDITVDQIRRAGYDTRAALLRDVNARTNGNLYRISFRHAGGDPRQALRDDNALTSDEIRLILLQLTGFDRNQAGANGTLDLIRRHPGIRAAEQAPQLGLETVHFKQRVRKLKELGLTESLDVGYRLSARGRVIHGAIKKQCR